MSKNKVGDSGSTQDKKNLNRRNFIKRSAAIGVGTAAFGTASAGPTQAQAMTWDYEADIVVLGAGATGLPAAIRARVPRDNQGETAATIKMRLSRGWADGARA